MSRYFRQQLKIAFKDIVHAFLPSPSELITSPSSVIRCTIQPLLHSRKKQSIPESRLSSSIRKNLLGEGLCTRGLKYVVRLKDKAFLVEFRAHKSSTNACLGPATRLRFRVESSWKDLLILRRSRSDSSSDFTGGETDEEAGGKGKADLDIKRGKSMEKLGSEKDYSDDDDSFEDGEELGGGCILPAFLPDPVGLGIGGLGAEFAEIFRLAFVFRTRHPNTIAAMGQKHTRGVLLHGPPGTGKTLMARQLAVMLQAAKITKLAATDILDKFVGEGERKIRELFAAAAANPEEFHVIIIDELDSVFRRRGTGTNTTGDSLVNALLEKMDGTDSPDNFLIVATTNRPDIIDDALLRPGRFELVLEIGLPDVDGRLEILQIHSAKLELADDVDLISLANQTVNFSGAEIAGLCRAAASWAIQQENDRHFLTSSSTSPKQSSVVDSKLIHSKPVLTQAHFEKALKDIVPKFGRGENLLKNRLSSFPFFSWSERIIQIRREVSEFISNGLSPRRLTHLSTLLLHSSGSDSKTHGTGKSTLALHALHASGADFIKVIDPSDLIHLGSDRAQADRIVQIFHDANKSARSVILLDDLECIVHFLAHGSQYSPLLLQTLLVLLTQPPEKNETRIVVIATSSSSSSLSIMELLPCFQLALHLPNPETPKEIETVIQETANHLLADSPEHLSAFQHEIEKETESLKNLAPIPIKVLVRKTETWIASSEYPE